MNQPAESPQAPKPLPRRFQLNVTKTELILINTAIGIAIEALIHCDPVSPDFILAFRERFAHSQKNPAQHARFLDGIIDLAVSSGDAHDYAD